MLRTAHKPREMSRGSPFNHAHLFSCARSSEKFIRWIQDLRVPVAKQEVLAVVRTLIGDRMVSLVAR
eukprot:COSAG06_NODE_1101_length_10696_cov_15.719260_3_plen_67_part_00